MKRLDRRTLERLEAKHPKVSVNSPRRDELEEYFKLLENARAEIYGNPPPHDMSYLDDRPPDPVVEAYFRELEEQVKERERSLQQALQRREQR